MFDRSIPQTGYFFQLRTFNKNCRGTGFSPLFRGSKNGGAGKDIDPQKPAGLARKFTVKTIDPIFSGGDTRKPQENGEYGEISW